jgi:hypothetical protein
MRRRASSPQGVNQSLCMRDLEYKLGVWEHVAPTVWNQVCVRGWRCSL